MFNIIHHNGSCSTILLIPLSFFQKSSIILWAIGVLWVTKWSKDSFELIHYSALSLSRLILTLITLLYFATSSWFDQLTYKNSERLKDFFGLILDLSEYLYLWSHEEHWILRLATMSFLICSSLFPQTYEQKTLTSMLE